MSFLFSNRGFALPACALLCLDSPYLSLYKLAIKDCNTMGFSPILCYSDSFLPTGCSVHVLRHAAEEELHREDTETLARNTVKPDSMRGTHPK